MLDFLSKTKINEQRGPFLVITLFAFTCIFGVAINYFGHPVDYFWRFLFVAFFLLCLSSLVFFSRNRLKRWLRFEINPRYMVLTRVLYAILCLVSAIQHFGLIKYGLEPYNFLLLGWKTPSSLAYVLSALYITGLVMLLVGYRIRLAWIIVFLFGGMVIPFSLEIFVKNIFNFYAIFISSELWKGKKTKDGIWAIPLMAISVGVLMFTAGLHKAIDPVWQAGLGFYYSLNISYFPKRMFWFLLDYHWLMVLFNWMTVIAELIMLPLLIFKRGWLYANFCVLGLGLFLSLGMSGIGIMGGPIVICMFLLFLAICTEPQEKVLAINKLRIFNVNLHKNDSGRWLHSMTLGLVFFWYTVMCSFGNMYEDFRQAFNNMPIAYSGFKNTKPNKKGWERDILKSTDFLYQKLRIIQPHHFYQFTWSLALFDYHHLFDRLYFKVVFVDKNGVEKELVKYYDDDGAVARDHPLFGSEKFLLTCFRIMAAVTSKPYISTKQLRPQIQNELEAVVRYSLAGQNPEEFVGAFIRVVPMHQPYEYSGNYKPWINLPWTDFFYYDMKTGKGTVINEIKVYDYQKLRIEAFSNKTIVPKFN